MINPDKQCNKQSDKQYGKSWVGEFHGFVMVSHRPSHWETRRTGWIPIEKLGSALDQIKNAGPMKDSAVMKIFLVHTPYAKRWLRLAQKKLMECPESLKLQETYPLVI